MTCGRARLEPVSCTVVHMIHTVPIVLGSPGPRLQKADMYFAIGQACDLGKCSALFSSPTRASESDEAEMRIK